MSILEILEAHYVSTTRENRVVCKTCGILTEEILLGGEQSYRLGITHQAQVLEQHERERCYEAWSSGWHDSHYQHTAHNERRGQGHPEVVYSNPYRGRP